MAVEYCVTIGLLKFKGTIKINFSLKWQHFNLLTGYKKWLLVVLNVIKILL